MKEKDFQRFVFEQLRLGGWRFAHFGNSVKYVRKGDGYLVIPDKDSRGFPDIIAVKGERIIALELKGTTTRIRPEQLEWIADLRTAGVEAHIWRPDDYDAYVLR